MPHRHVRVALHLAAVMLAAAPMARAQTCMGFASFAAGDLRMGGNLGVSGDTKIAGASFAFGESTGLFGGPSFDFVSYPAPFDKALVYTGTVGWGIDLADRGAVALCPLLVGSYQDGPVGASINRRVDISGKSLGLGLSLGGDVMLAPRAHLAPFASAVWMTSSTVTVIQDIIDLRSTTTDRFVAVTVGVGVVFDKVWTIRPSLSFPVGLSGGSTTVGVAVSINAGNGPSE